MAEAIDRIAWQRRGQGWRSRIAEESSIACGGKRSPTSGRAAREAHGKVRLAGVLALPRGHGGMSQWLQRTGPLASCGGTEGAGGIRVSSRN